MLSVKEIQWVGRGIVKLKVSRSSPVIWSCAFINPTQIKTICSCNISHTSKRMLISPRISKIVSAGFCMEVTPDEAIAKLHGADPGMSDLQLADDDCEAIVPNIPPWAPAPAAWVRRNARMGRFARYHLPATDCPACPHVWNVDLGICQKVTKILIYLVGAFPTGKACRKIIIMFSQNFFYFEAKMLSATLSRGSATWSAAERASPTASIECRSVEE